MFIFIDKCSQFVNVKSNIEKSESMTPLLPQQPIYAPCFIQAEQPIVRPIHQNQKKGCAIKLTDPKTGEDLTDVVLKPKERHHSDKRSERFLVSTEYEEKLEANADTNVASQVRCLELTSRFPDLFLQEFSENVTLNYLKNVCNS